MRHILTPSPPDDVIKSTCFHMFSMNSVAPLDVCIHSVCVACSWLFLTTHTHHESRDVSLGGVRGQVDLLGGAALVLRVDHHAVAGESGQASQAVLLTRHGPVHGEGGRAHLGELQVGGRRDSWRRERERFY